MLLRFLEVVEDRVAPTTLSKGTLTELCHTLEDQIVAEDLGGTVLAGFQRARYFEVERARYEALAADPRRRAVVFTADAATPGTAVEQVTVGEEHELAREWFVLALTDACSAVLFGRELVGAQQPEDQERQFLTIWSFDPTVVGDLAEVLLASAADLAPDRYAVVRGAVQAQGPRVPEPLVVQRFMNAVLDRLQSTDRRPVRVSSDRAVDGSAAPAEQALNREAYAALRAAAARVATGMDAPMTAITTAAAALAEVTEPAERERLIGTIEVEASRASQLAGGLQEPAWPEAVALERVDLVAWLRRETDRLRTLGIDLELAALPDGLWHSIDEVRLRRALAAVLADANAAPGRSAPPRVALDGGPGTPSIVVRRDGVVPLDAQLRTARQRAGAAHEDPATPEFALAAALLATQGGELRLSCDGHLTSYRLRLPAEAPTAVRPDEDPARTPAAAGPSAAPTTDAPQEPVAALAALIVDDEPAIRGLVEALLRRAGWTVHAAASVEEARQVTREHHLDAVLLDLHLVGEDGRGFLDELERLRPGTAARTIIVTDDPAAVNGRHDRPVVRKPFAWAELSEALDRVTSPGADTLVDAGG